MDWELKKRLKTSAWDAKFARGHLSGAIRERVGCVSVWFRNTVSGQSSQGNEQEDDQRRTWSRSP